MENKVNDMPTAELNHELTGEMQLFAVDYKYKGHTEEDADYFLNKYRSRILNIFDKHSDLKCNALLERIKELEYDYNALNETLIGRINELENELKEMTLDRDSVSQAWSQEHGYHLELQELVDKLAEALITRDPFLYIEALTNYRKLKQ